MLPGVHCFKRVLRVPSATYVYTRKKNRRPRDAQEGEPCRIPPTNAPLWALCLC